MGYIIDSNVVIDYLSGQMPDGGMSFIDSVVNDRAVISVMTEIEVLGFNNAGDVEYLLKDFIDCSIVIALSDEIVRETIEVRKTAKIKTPDAIIAATAMALNHTLATRNINDFRKIKRLNTLNPGRFDLSIRRFANLIDWNVHTDEASTFTMGIGASSKDSLFLF